MGEKITYSSFKGVYTLGCLMDGFQDIQDIKYFSKGIPHYLSVFSQRNSPLPISILAKGFSIT